MEKKISAENQAQAAKEHLKDIAEDVHAEADAKAARVQEAVENVWSRVQTWQTEMESYVRLNPTRAIFMAVGLGFTLGCMYRK